VPPLGIGEAKKNEQISIRKSEGEILLRKLIHRHEDNIK
jgi:hypothetical protein